jgi:hypothetical protein
MAFYSSGDIVTKYLDARSFVSDQRAIFELDLNHAAYLPNLRLLNIGVFGDADKVYNRLIGANAIIREIRLEDGRQVLTQCKEFGLYRGFQAVNKPNTRNMSVSSPQACSQLGYQESNVSGLLDYNQPAQVTKAARGDAQASFATLDLREVLPMLNSVTHLPTKLFKNLRLIIDFDTSAARQISQNITDAFTGQELPILAVDCLDNQVIVDKMTRAIGNSIGWLEVEHDQVTFEDPRPAGADASVANVVQTLNAKLDGFKNKKVERLLQVKELVDSNAYVNANVPQGFGRYQSVAAHNEAYQVRLNGTNIYPQNGMTKPMERLGYLNDLYGEFSLYPGANQPDLDAGIVIGSDLADGRAKVGNLSYNGFYIGDKVVDLQIEHRRTGLEDTSVYRPSTLSLNIHYYAEVHKAVVFGKGGYRIVYL